jgi:hypothetical protein
MHTSCRMTGTERLRGPLIPGGCLIASFLIGHPLFGNVWIFFTTIPPRGGQTKTSAAAAWECKDVRLNGNPLDCCDCRGHLFTAQMAEQAAGRSTSTPGPRPVVYRVEAVGHYGLSPVAWAPCLLFRTMEQPLAFLSLCGGWSRHPGVGHLLGGFGLHKRRKVTFQSMRGQWTRRIIVSFMSSNHTVGLIPSGDLHESFQFLWIVPHFAQESIGLSLSPVCCG